MPFQKKMGMIRDHVVKKKKRKWKKKKYFMLSFISGI